MSLKNAWFWFGTQFFRKLSAGCCWKGFRCSNLLLTFIAGAGLPDKTFPWNFFVSVIFSYPRQKLEVQSWKRTGVTKAAWPLQRNLRSDALF